MRKGQGSAVFVIVNNNVPVFRGFVENLEYCTCIIVKTADDVSVDLIIDACSIEHHISDESFEAIKRYIEEL